MAISDLCAVVDSIIKFSQKLHSLSTTRQHHFFFYLSIFRVSPLSLIGFKVHIVRYQWAYRYWQVLIKSMTPKVEMSECSGCSRCQMEDCGNCRSCKDKPKNGGRGTLRKICEIRAQNAKCNAKSSPRAPKESPMSKVKKSPKASSSAEEGTTDSGLRECKVRISHVTPKESAMAKASKKRSLSPNDLGDSLLSKARTKTTLAGETSKKSLTPQGRRKRCGKCSGCKKENCGLCRNCRDMPKFGGKGKLRLACALRVCRELSTSPKDLEKSTKTVMQVWPLTSISTFFGFLICEWLPFTYRLARLTTNLSYHTLTQSTSDPLSYANLFYIYFTFWC